MDKSTKWLIIGGIIFLLVAMAWSLLAPPKVEVSPCPPCNPVVNCPEIPPCPECPSLNVTVPTADPTIPSFTETEVENITLNYISNLRDDPRSWFEVMSMVYSGDSGSWTVEIKYECPGQRTSRTFIVTFNEVSGNLY